MGTPRLPRVLIDSVDSTMDEARRRAEAGEGGPLWIVARRQTAGRGRRGRAWVSEPGNLYATLLLRDPCPPAFLGQLCLVAALALHDALAARLPPKAARALAIKWPNDLLLSGAKLAGILAESAGPPAHPAASVALGFGVNCRHHPAGTAYPATDLVAHGADVEPLRLLAALEPRLMAQLEVWNRGVGFASIREHWLARAHGLGEPATVRLGSEELAGVFAGLDPEGRLVLRQSDGRDRLVAAGEVTSAPQTAG